ncbi:Sodium/calcium exchanger protein-domain-containing protein [Scleroderma yunnanense]
MSSRNAKAFLLACLFIQCVLWSRSRYAQLPYEYQFHHSASASLWKRSPPSTLTIEHSKCRPFEYQEQSASQCTHVQRECPISDTVLSIPYLQIYFCSIPSIRPFVFTALVLWLFFLFSTLGISASDFFTPNLATIANFLGLDENVAGVTFLAFGNASPDVFGTFSAMRADSGSLAIGELLGAASFIVSCVVGSMCIIRPFRVNPFPFLRDVGFFTVAVMMLLVILRDGHIQSWESGMLIVWYICYACTVIVGSWWEGRMEKKRRIEALIRAEYSDSESPLQHYTDEEPYRDELPPVVSPSSSETLTVPLQSPTPIHAQAVSGQNPPRITVQTHLQQPPKSSRTPSPINTPAHLTQMPSFSLVGALEFRQVVASLQNQAAGSSLNIFDSPAAPYAGGHYHRRHSGSRTPPSLIGTDHEPEPWGNDVPLNDRSPRLLRSSIIEDREREESHLPSVLEEGMFPRSPLSVPTIPSISHTPASPIGSDASTDVERYVPPTKGQRIYRILARTWYILFPSLHHFGSKTLLGKVAALLAAPAVMALTLTLPVVVVPYGNGGGHEEKVTRHHHHGTSEAARLAEFEEEGVERARIAEEVVLEDLHEMEFNKWLMAAQCVFGPLFCAAVLFNGSDYIEWILAGTAVGGVAIGLLVLMFADGGVHPTARMARCSMGFLVAIVWIMAIADEVVHVLQAFGFIFGLSEAIIGLTIFAVGNSLADLVANMSVAVFAPIMGFSACFGGPMVNLLLGVGISGSYIISQNGGKPYTLYFTPTLVSSTLGLLGLLLVTLIVVPLNGYVLTRKWGIFLVFAYVMLMTIHLMVELRY